MSIENDFGTTTDNREIVMEQAMYMASTHPDTPLDGGFGYEFEDRAARELIMTRGKPVAIAGFRLPGVRLEDIERVTSLKVVPYAGDERPPIHVRQSINPQYARVSSLMF